MSDTPNRRRPLRIAVSARLMHSPPKELGFRGKKLQYLEQSIAHWIMRHGGLVFMLPTLVEGGDVSRHNISVKSYVAELDALVLQGGADVSPESYGETPERPEWSGDRVRDLYEIELLWEFIAQNKPVLGVCRGCQLINVAMGGSLHQDIATQIEGSRVHVHPDLYDTLYHEIEFKPNSRLGELFAPQTHALVNSIHHQSVKRLGNDLVIEAVCPEDNVVEAIRWKGSGYVVGFQWHPEFHQAAGPTLESEPIIQDFLEQARKMRGE